MIVYYVLLAIFVIQLVFQTIHCGHVLEVTFASILVRYHPFLALVVLTCPPLADMHCTVACSPQGVLILEMDLIFMSFVQLHIIVLQVPCLGFHVQVGISALTTLPHH